VNQIVKRFFPIFQKCKIGKVAKFFFPLYMYHRIKLISIKMPLIYKIQSESMLKTSFKIFYSIKLFVFFRFFSIFPRKYLGYFSWKFHEIFSYKYYRSSFIYIRWRFRLIFKNSPKKYFCKSVNFCKICIQFLSLENQQCYIFLFEESIDNNFSDF
jgi:hypothetical protein